VSQAPLPSLDALAIDPGGAVTLPPDTATVLLARCGMVQSALIARLLAASHRPVGPTEDQDCLLPVPAVAELLAVPASYAYELARQGKLPTIHLGKYVRVRASALTAWLDRRSAGEFDGGTPTVTRTTAATPASRGRLTPAPGRRPWSSRAPRPERRRDRASILPPSPPGAAADDA
jgi:excisionase family DNA binding protein